MTAPRVAGWQQSGGQFGVTLGGGSRGGQPFLPNVLQNAIIWVEAAWGADLTGSPDAYPWTDITADVMHGSQVTISQGRADETSQAQAAQCSFSLLNTGNKYTPYNPMAVNWPNVKRGTPVRVRVDVGTGAYTLFQGAMVGATPAWDTSANLATVAVVAAGTLRRLTQGKTPLRSALYRSLVVGSVLATPPSAYWPMEDGASATSCVSAIDGVANMTATGSVKFSADGPAGSAPVPNFGSGGSLTGLFTTPASVVRWIIHATIKPSTETGQTVILSWRTTGGLYSLLSANSGGGDLRIIFESNDLSNIGFQQLNLPATWFNGGWHDFVITGQDDGAGGTLMFVGTDNHITGAVFDGTGAGVLPIRQIVLNQMTGTGAGSGLGMGSTPSASNFGVGHVAVWNLGFAVSGTKLTAALFSAFGGYVGETATDRLVRLCGEEGVPLTVKGTSAMTMGPQPLAAFVDVLRDCETADGGVLFDGFDAGIRYTALSARYNQAAAVTVDANADQLTPPFAPVDDDQRNRNDVTVSRNGGSSARFIDTDGPLGTDTIGTYDSTLQVNTATDDVLNNRAAWEVHLGTVEGLRFPTLPFDFTASPELIQSWLDAPTIGFRTDVLNVVDRAIQAPPDDLSLIVEGYTQQIDTVSWKATANCSPAQPWQVAIVQDAIYPLRVDSDSSVLDLDATAVSNLQVRTSGPIWTTTATNPADFPFDIDIAGEQITVTSILGVSSPQIFIVTRSVNGVVANHAAGSTTVKLWHPAVIAL